MFSAGSTAGNFAEVATFAVGICSSSKTSAAIWEVYGHRIIVAAGTKGAGRCMKGYYHRQLQQSPSNKGERSEKADGRKVFE